MIAANASAATLARIPSNTLMESLPLHPLEHHEIGIEHLVHKELAA